MSEDNDEKYLRPAGDEKMKEAWDVLNKIDLSPQEKLREQLDRLPLDKELKGIVTEGLMRTSDEEALKMAAEMEDALEKLVAVVDYLKDKK